MVILHISPINMTRANGFRFSVPGLVSAQNCIEGISAALMNIGDPNKLIEREVSNFDFTFFSSDTDLDKLPIPYNRPDIVIFHGVYLYNYIKLYKKLLKRNIPYIIVPRVSLTEGAQKQNKTKKMLGNIFLFNKFINKSAYIQYLTINEKEQSSRFNKKNFVTGNGIELPVISRDEKRSKINMVFIGRYDLNHKGLDLLINAIVNIKDKLKKSNVTIDFYGSDFRGGKKYLKDEIEKHKMDDLFKVHDAIFGDEKQRVLNKANIFISTSRFEGHPMAVIEAMAYGIPCILTKGTNMLDDLIKYDAGWATELDVNSISNAILFSIADCGNWVEKGKNARKLIEENYTWNTVAKKTIVHYKNIVN